MENNKYIKEPQGTDKKPFYPRPQWLIGLAVIYGVLLFLEVLCRTDISTVKIGPIPCAKLNIPLAIGWSTVLEWAVPFLLYVGYISLWINNRKLFVIIRGILVAGFLECCFGRYGLKFFSSGSGILFSGNARYWQAADSVLGRYLPLYFIGWYLCALVLLLFAERITERLFTRKRQVIAAILLFLFCLSEGFLFQITYFRTYTFWFVLRNIMLLPLVAIYCIQRSSFQKKETENHQKSFKAICGIVGCAFLFMLLGGLEYGKILAANPNDYSFYAVHILTKYLFRNYAFIMTGVLSICFSHTRLSMRKACTLAIFCSTACLIEWQFKTTRAEYPVYMQDNVRQMAQIIGLMAWMIMLYLCFIWLCGRAKVVDIAFVTLLYALELRAFYGEWKILLLYRDSGNNVRSICQIGLLCMMYIITVIVLSRKCYCMDSPHNQSHKVIYALMVVYTLMVVGDHVKTEWDGYFFNTTMYLIPLMVMATYLAYVLCKKELFVFCSIMTFATSMYLNSEYNYYPNGLRWSLGIPWYLGIILIILLFFLLFTNLSDRKSRKIGCLFGGLSYVLIFYGFMIPRLAEWKEGISGNEHIVPYCIEQGILLVLAVLIFILTNRNEGKRLDDIQ